MSETAPGLYTGLDRLIAKPTKPEAAVVPTPVAVEAPQQDATTAGSGGRQGDERQKTAATPETGANLVRRLEPNLPDAPDLYRKQTINFGPDDLEAVHRMQEAVGEGHDQAISKQDIVRAAVEFLLKDFEAHKEESFLMRKFVRR